MLAGGERTRIPRGLAVTEPYDSLSVVPTILALTGDLRGDNRPVKALARRGFVKFPGRVIPEIAGQNFKLGSGAPAQWASDWVLAAPHDRRTQGANTPKV